MAIADILYFLLFFVGLGLYLLWSAKTEMGTKSTKKSDCTPLYGSRRDRP